MSLAAEAICLETVQFHRGTLCIVTYWLRPLLPHVTAFHESPKNVTYFTDAPLR